MDLLILSVIPTNGAKEGEKLVEGDKNRGRGVEKKGKAVKRKRRVEFGWQERVHGLGGSHICALLPGYTTSSSFLMLGCSVQDARALGRKVVRANSTARCQTKSQGPWQRCTNGNTLPLPRIREETKGSRMKSPRGGSSSHRLPIRPAASPGTSHLPLIPIPAQPLDPSRRSRRSPDCHRQEQKEEKGKGHGACGVGGGK